MMLALSDDVLGSQASSIVQNVFMTMLGAAVEPVPETELAVESPLTAAIHYVGAWKGALILECSAAQATRWAAQLMPITPPISLEDARDGLGELTNMISGNLKPLLPPGVGLSIPSVIDGAGHKLHLPGAEPRGSLTFCDESGPFRIGLVLFPDSEPRRS